MKTETRLWQDWRGRHDEDAFEALVRQHLRFLQDFARRAGCQAADADDAVQATLVALATQNGNKPVQVGLRAWLGRSLRSHIGMLFRSRRRRRRHEERAQPPRERSGSGPPVRDEVEAALAKLDDASREAVILRFLHDLDYAEIAHILGRSENACRLRVHRAIARLRRDFGDKAVALVAALPLLAGRADARMALAEAAAASSQPAAVTATFWGGLLVSTKTWISLVVVALLATAAVVWNTQRGEKPHRVRAVREEQATARGPNRSAPNETGEPEPAAVTTSTAGHVPDDAPISPGKGSAIGTLRFRDGTPLEGVRVALWGASEIEDTTDGRGFFHLHDEWVADRVLYIKGPHGYAFGLEEIKMQKGERVRVDLVLERGVVLEGWVVAQQTARPIATATVTLRRVPGTMAGQGSFGFVHTDEQGRFRFEYVPRASYTLDSCADGYEGREYAFDLRHDPAPERIELKRARRLRIRIEGAPAAAQGGEISWSLQRLGAALRPSGKARLGADNELLLDAPTPGEWRLTLFRSKHLPRFEETVRITKEPLEPVVLRVSGARVTGVLVDRTGDPVAGARISGKGLTAKTNAEGRFVFASHPTGSQQFGILFDGGWLRLGHFEIPHQGDLRLRLPGTGVAQGRVSCERTENVTGFFKRQGESLPVGSVKPNPDGTFRIPYLAAGDYELNLQLFWGETVSRTFTLAYGATADLGTIALSSYPSVPVVLTVPAGSERPRWLMVTYRENEKRLPMSRYAQLDDNGRGEARGIPPGLQSLMFQANGFATQTLTVHVGPDMAPVRVELSPDPTSRRIPLPR